MNRAEFVAMSQVHGMQALDVPFETLTTKAEETTHDTSEIKSLLQRPLKNAKFFVFLRLPVLRDVGEQSLVTAGDMEATAKRTPEKKLPA